LIEPTSSDASTQQPKKRVGLSTTVGPDRLEGIHGRKSDRRSLVGAVGLRIVAGIILGNIRLGNIRYQTTIIVPAMEVTATAPGDSG